MPIRKIFFICAILSLIFPSFVLAAWSEPAGSPPLGNVELPINISNLSQIKDGALSVKGESPTVKGFMVGTTPSLTSFIQLGTSGQNLIYGAINPSSVAGTSLLKLETCVAGPTCTTRLVVTKDGNVGIGTASPGGKLEVTGGNSKFTNSQLLMSDGYGMLWGSVGVYAYSAGDYIRFDTASGGMRLTSGGNLGIGTSAPGYKLDVQGGQINASSGLCIGGDCKTAWSQVAGTNYWTASGNNIYNNNTGNVGIGTASPSRLMTLYSAGSPVLRWDFGAGTWDVRANGTAGSALQFDLNGSPQVLINSSGNVGIGTTNPGVKLDINGSVRGNIAGALRIDSANGTVDIGAQNTSYAHIYTDRPSFYLNTPLYIAGANVYFGSAGQSSYISNGNLGIGTASPGYKLDAWGSAWNNIARIYSTGGSSGIDFFDNNGTRRGVVYSDSSGFGLLTSGTNWAVMVKSGTDTIYMPGSVGIGTWSPGEKLAVSNNIVLGTSVSGLTAAPSFINLGANYSNGATRDKLKIYLYNGGGDEQYGFGVGSGGDIQYHSNGTHDFYIKNSLKLRVNTNGNVSIGTTNSAYRLEVGGSVRLSGGGILDTDNSRFGIFTGIGTLSPSTYLHVTGGSGDYIAKIFNTSGGAGSPGLLISAGDSGPGGAANMIYFQRPDGVSVGRIQKNTANTVAYITNSDERLKENIVGTKYGLNDLLNIKVRDFTWKNDLSKKISTGFIAQELYDVYPEVVSKPADVNKDTWGVDYGKLTPLLTKSIQELYQIIQKQQEQIDRLEKIIELK